jgi:hypothetical protein
MKIPCTVCGRIEYAGGFCRGHYMQLWRYGRITSRELRGRQQPKEPDEREELEKELYEAERVYALVVSLAQRIRWRVRIVNIKLRLEEIKREAKP